MAIAEFGRPVEAAIERAMRERAAEPETPDGGEVVRGGGTPLEHLGIDRSVAANGS